MDIISLVNKTLALFAAASQVFIILTIACFLFFRGKKSILIDFFGRRGVVFAFLISFFSVLSSLFYSEIAGFPPCPLCWSQRILIYPLPILLLLAILKNKERFLNLSLAFSAIGFLVSLYHNFIYYSQGGLAAICQFSAAGVSCTKRYVFEFGYITIPLMSLTAFALVIVFLVLGKLENKT